MDTLLLSENEIRIINVLRSMKSYEGVFVQADVTGRPDSFIVSRSTKMVLISGEIPKAIIGRPMLASSD